MRYLLIQFPSVSTSDLRALALLDLATTDQLLDRAAMPAAREALAQQSGISFERLTRLAGLADLIRVKGIGPRLAEVFVDAGAAGNIQQLVERSTDLPALRQMLCSYLEGTGGHVRPVSLSQLGEMCSEARELRPRLLLQALKPDPEFRCELFHQSWLVRKESFKISLGMFMVVLVPLTAMLLLIERWAQGQMQEPFSPYQDLNRLYLSIQQIRFDLFARSSWTLLLILLSFVFLLILLYEGIGFIQSTWLVLFLFSTPGQQEFYKWVNSIDLKKQVRAMWWVVLVLALLAIGLMIIALNYLFDESTFDQGLLTKKFAQILIPGGVLMGVVASLPILSFFRKTVPGRKEASQEHIQRYFVYYMSKIMMLPVMVVLLTQVTMPLGISIHDRLMSEQFIPDARAAILEKRQALIDMQSRDPAKLAWRDYAVVDVDETILSVIETLGMVVTPEDSSLVEVIIPAALNIVVWIALTALLLLFVAPYLMLGGWTRGLFYMFILGISFALENQLTVIAPTWFRLPADSISQGPFIAFFVLINALFFDWLFDVVTNRKKICPACKTELDKKFLFCSECGYQQQ